MHNFDSPPDAGNCGSDVSVAMGPGLEYFYNQWQLQTTGDIPLDPMQNSFSEWSETVIFSFPAFPNASEPDEATANDRPLYAAVNMVSRYLCPVRFWSCH